MLSPETLALEVHQRLLNAYGQPVWRVRLPPVDELISTILSQNTNDVIDAIKIAGLSNQKGPRIQWVLRQITDERGEINLDFLRQLPPDEVRAWLLRFKGVGPKTAAIVMLFSLDMPAFPVDTHIYRVTGRLGLRPEGVDAEKAHELLGKLFPPETYYAAHLNLIRHGRQICLARSPACDRCTLQDLCVYYREFVAESVTLKSDG